MRKMRRTAPVVAAGLAMCLTALTSGTAEAATQADAPWDLARISHRSTNFDPTVHTDYNYDEGQREITVYVLATGINPDHRDLAGRIAGGQSFVPEEPDTIDRNGMGTYVAGLVAGSTYGVTKNAKVVPVKVLDTTGSGSMHAMFQGVRWATEDCGDKSRCVAVLPFKTGRSPALNEAASSAHRAGMPVVVPAGDERQDACNVSPASAPGTMTVAASDSGDRFASSSNYGRCTHVIAPGVDVPSTWIGGPTAVHTRSGTEAAAALTAGLIAYYRSKGLGMNSPDDAYRVMIQHSLPGVIKGVPSGTPNRLALNDN